jgi:molecular chaperone GrpE
VSDVVKLMEESADGTAATPEANSSEAELDMLRKEANELRQALEAEVSRSREYLDLARHIQADFDNYKKRSSKEREDTIRSANDRMVSELLLILDDLERATGLSMSEEQLRQGVNQIQVNLRSLLKGYGLKEIPCEQFDPQMHEAFGVGEGDEGQILEVYQKGYCLGPRVIRHSKVKVGKRLERGENNG